MLPSDAPITIAARASVAAHEVHPLIQRQPVKKAGTKAWKAALARADIKDFRWHDLRQTQANWHVQSGAPLHVTFSF